MARIILRLLPCPVAGPVFLRLMAIKARAGSALQGGAPQNRLGRLGNFCASKSGASRHMDINKAAKFGIGQQVRHRLFPFRGVIYDVDPQFANTEEWWESIPEEIRPVKNQPFYHLLAENDFVLLRGVRFRTEPAAGRRAGAGEPPADPGNVRDRRPRRLPQARHPRTLTDGAARPLPAANAYIPAGCFPQLSQSHSRACPENLCCAPRRDRTSSPPTEPKILGTSPRMTPWAWCDPARTGRFWTHRFQVSIPTISTPAPLNPADSRHGVPRLHTCEILRSSIPHGGQLIAVQRRGVDAGEREEPGRAMLGAGSS